MITSLEKRELTALQCTSVCGLCTVCIGLFGLCLGVIGRLCSVIVAHILDLFYPFFFFFFFFFCFVLHLRIS